MGGGRAYEVVRLEALAEELLDDGTGRATSLPAIEEALQDSTAVAAKSIAAYRIGLDLPAERLAPTRSPPRSRACDRQRTGGTGSPIQ